MAFNPRYDELFESVVLDNILAIAERDYKAALDLFYPADDFPDIEQRTLGNFIRIALPALAAEPNSGTDNESDDGSHLGPQVKVTLYLAVEDADPTETLRKLIKYVRVLRSVLKTAKDADYTVNAPKVFGLVRELSWQYGQIAKDANRGLWMQPATFELVLKYNER